MGSACYMLQRAVGSAVPVTCNRQTPLGDSRVFLIKVERLLHENIDPGLGLPIRYELEDLHALLAVPRLANHRISKQLRGDRRMWLVAQGGQHGERPPHILLLQRDNEIQISREARMALRLSFAQREGEQRRTRGNRDVLLSVDEIGHGIRVNRATGGKPPPKQALQRF